MTVKNTVVGSSVELGCLVVRLVVGALGVTVTPRVVDTRPVVWAWVVREVNLEVVD